MKWLRKIPVFFKLPLRRQFLLIAVVPLSLYTYIIFRFSRKIARFGEMTKAPITLHDGVDMALVKDMSVAINAVSKYTPWHNVCRHQAYQAKILCRYYRIPYTIYVGFRKNQDGIIEGHAWTMVNEKFVTGFCNVNEYTVQTVFS
jgi:hypothetical protein